MKLRIGGVIYKVSFSHRRMENVSYDFGGGPLAGHCDKSYQRISVSKRQSKAGRRETLWHEVLHASCDAAGLEDVLNGSEENVVNRLSKVTLTVLRDNPELVEFLLAGISTEGTVCPPPRMKT